MDPRMLQYYNRELQHAREMGAEFAREFPKVAGRLGMENLECADPYVERLLEGFAFMAARIQLKLDAEFPRFTQHLFELVYPHYLTPIPSMMVVQLQPDLTNPSLNNGERIPRDTAIRSVAAGHEQSSCEYRTSNDVDLWPVELTEVRYFPTAGALANINVEGLSGVRAGIRLRLRCTSGVAFQETSIDSLPVFLPGGGDVPKNIYEQMLGNCAGVVVRPKGGSDPWQVRLPETSARRHGFDRQQALLPYTRRSFEGYRLLQEYFSFPERFLFVEFGDLGDAIKRCNGTELEIIVLLNRSINWLEGAVDVSQFALFCTPAINLFPKRADRVNVDRGKTEYHVLADRTRPLDFEVHSVSAVRGYSGGTEASQDFFPFYTSRDLSAQHDLAAYFTVRREPRAIPSKARREGTRSSYVGSETFISLVDGREAPFSPDLRQLEFTATCTNRDLPLQMTLGTGTTDFTIDTGGSVQALRCVSGPTPPRSAPVHAQNSWRLLSHLSLNYLSLAGEDGSGGPEALRQILGLYADINDATVQKQSDGLRLVESKPIVRRLPSRGPITFGRGLEIALTCDESAFEATGAYLFGAVMEEFLARYVSLNSFTETVLRTTDRGEVMRWPARIGRRHRL